MTVVDARLPVSLDPLIAEAKRRARNRRLLLAVLVLALALGGGGATLVVRPFGWLRTASPYAGPYEPGGMVTGVGGIPPAASGAVVQAVSAASRSDAWVVGSVARRWDRGVWRNVPLPRSGEDTLWAVTTRAPDDAWAAGWRSDGVGPNALIEHWNGVRWSIVRLPRLGQSMLYDVAAAGRRNAWAVGAAYVP